jgi:hypothetical protein
MNKIGDLFDSISGGSSAAKQIKRGAETDAAAQREALDYLKQTEAAPQFYRESALDTLASFYGMPTYSPEQAPGTAMAPFSGGRGGPKGSPFRGGMGGERVVGEGLAPRDAAPTAPPQGQSPFIEGVQQSPFYGQMIQTGEEAIGRNLSMTGGLRSGTANEALAQNSQNVLQTLVNQRLQGISGMAQLPSNATNIAGYTAGIGQTLGQGQIAAGQAIQSGRSGIMQMAGQAGGAYMMSDPRLKTNKKKVGRCQGVDVFTWTWNKLAGERFNLFGNGYGVMANLVKKSHPQHVTIIDGYYAVHYEGLFNG